MLNLCKGSVNTEINKIIEPLFFHTIPILHTFNKFSKIYKISFLPDNDFL